MFIREFMEDVLAEVRTRRVNSAAIPEQYPLLRTVQFAAPAMGIYERLQGLGAVGAVCIYGWKRGLAEGLSSAFNLPEKLFTLRVAKVVQILHIDNVQPSLPRSAVVRLDGANRRQSVTDTHGLPDFRDCGNSGRHLFLQLK